jgi:hypothetical protein
MFYTPPPGKERLGSQPHDPDKGTTPEEERSLKKEIWEIGPSGASPELEPIPEPVAEQPRRRRLRRPVSRGGEDGTISVGLFLAQGPPRHTTVHVIPLEGAERAPPDHQTTPMAEDTADDPTTLMAEATREPPTEEETLPEPVQLLAYEPVAGTTTAEAEIQIPMWNLGERIPIEPTNLGCRHATSRSRGSR